MTDDKVYEDLSYDDVNTRRIKFVWKITDFSRNQKKLTSALFPFSAPGNGGKWRLQLNPIVDLWDKKGKFFNIKLLQEAFVVSWAEVKISLIDGMGDVGKKAFLVYKEDSECTVTCDRDFVLNKANGLLPNDELTMVCEMKIPVRSESPFPAKCEPPPCRLAEDLGKLLASESLSDVTIAVGGAELRAHKAVLAARSPVFAAMFSNDMLEKETSVVEITDFDADVVQTMLEFMYTGKEISQTSWAHDLLAAANKYQLERLKFMCEEALGKVLTVDNVLESLTLADLYNAPRLKEQCVSLIMAHRDDLRLAWDILKRSEESLVTEMLDKHFL